MKVRWQPTVQGWQNLVLAIMGVVVLAGAIAGAVLLNRNDQVYDELTTEIAPMRVAAFKLQAALRDQETAVRGYAISADPQFLEPYVAGQKDRTGRGAGDPGPRRRSLKGARRPGNHRAHIRGMAERLRRAADRRGETHVCRR